MTSPLALTNALAKEEDGPEFNQVVLAARDVDARGCRGEHRRWLISQGAWWRFDPL